MKKICTILAVLLASLPGFSQYIQGSIQQNGVATNAVDITFLPDFDSQTGTEAVNYISISIAMPTANAAGVVPVLTSVGTLFDGLTYNKGIPFSYTAGSETIFSWVYAAGSTSQDWIAGSEFVGATITFFGGTGSAPIRLVDFRNFVPAGGTNQNTYFLLVTNTSHPTSANTSKFDVTKYSAMFYQSPGSNAPGTYTHANGTDQYVETNVAIDLCAGTAFEGAIVGTSPSCSSPSTVTWTNPTGDPGGVWASSNTAVATINSSTGAITKIAAGTTNITYTVMDCTGTPLVATKSLTVTAQLNIGTVSGASPICIAATATYTRTGANGGTWSSSASGIASVPASQTGTTVVVTGVAAGTANIRYIIPAGGGCAAQTAQQSITVNPNVNAGTVSGTSPLCIGQITTYTSNGTTGGSWSSTNTAAATVNASTGAVTAVAAGTTNITYTLVGCGTTTAFKTLTVDPSVSAGTVSGTSPLCIAATATYTSSGTAGGTWSSTVPSVATVNASGLVTAVAAGTTNITYTVNTGCGSPVSSFKALTVSPNVTAGTVNGTTPLCIGNTATYVSTGTSGGSWSSTNTSVATVNASGVVTAVAAGTADITYTLLTTCGGPFTAFKNVTVNPNVTAGTVSGTTPLNVGATATYTSNGTAGGAWSSTVPGVATVDPGTGLVTAAAAGTTNITYTVNTGCGSPVSSFKTLTVNAAENPGTVSGATPLCIGATTAYTTNGDAGGSWSSTVPSVATVNPTSGLVTAVGAGTTNITYTIGSSSSFKTLTVDPNVSAGTVSGTSPLCIGATTTYTSNGTAGGSWSSTVPGVATVDPGTGLVTAVSAGTTNITYTVSSGCGSPLSSFKTLTVDPNVSAGTVSGTSPLCIGATTTYSSNGTAGGSWSSTVPSVATVNASGLVTAVAAGTTNITYTVNTGCGSPVSSFKTLTVSPNANAGTVSGTSPLCVAATATYTSNGDAGGTWSSTVPSVATVNASGLVTAVSAGTTNITYTVSTGCNNPVSAFKNLTVSTDPNPGTVSGTTPLCIGATTTYTSNGSGGGAWSSTNTAVATVNAGSGLVTAVSAGTTDIVYTVNACNGSPLTASKNLTVNPSVSAGTISGTSPLCIGATATYTSNGTAGGSWSSTVPGVATVDPGTGLVTAVSAGTTNITYTVNSGCGSPLSSFKTLTVSPNVSAGIVSGTSPLCIGATATYTSNGTSGGSWSSTVPGVATVDPGTGLVTAVAAGTTNITYTVNTGCGSPVSSFKTLTVDPNVSAGTVSGTSPLCIGATASYTSNGTAGGTWSSTVPSVATVNAPGLVTAVAAGTTNITYTVNTSCGSPVSSFKTLTVSPNANAGTVSGTSPLCIAATATYTSNGDAGGSWSSTVPSVATVNAAGLVTAVSAGTTNITYTVSTGCNNPVSAFKNLTVTTDPSPGTVSGTTPLCIGATATYTSNGSGGGSWSSTNTAVATVNAGSGLVTAVSAGTTDIVYTVNACNGTPLTASKNLTVDPSVSAGTVSGTSPLCIGATASYTSNGDAGGTWSSTVPSVATVNASGLVTAVAAGTTNITYTVNTGCGSPVSSFKTLTVSPNANAGTVSGTSPLCVGATATYTSNGDAGGTWSSTVPSVATVNAAGLVTAVSAGTTNITYTVSTGCNNPVSAFKNLTVTTDPSPGTVSGTTPLCIGATTTYTSNGSGGGSWSSTNTAVATVNAGSGLVTAVSAGTTDIVYTVNACNGTPLIALKNLTVSPNANAGTVSGTSPLCIGATATYTSNGDGGGSWSSTNTAVATVNASSGLVTAVAAGTTNITYTVSTGCNNPVSAFKALTVSTDPNAGTVSGTTPLCIGATTTYTSNGSGGGSWSSTNTAVATVNAGSGLVTAVSAGTTDIVYTVNACNGSPLTASKNLTVSPNISAGTVSGTSPLCIGATTTYTSNGTAGGSWSSTNTAVATVNASSGLVTAVAAGTTNITYTVSSGCGSPVSSFKALTVSANANAGTVSGTSPLLVSATATYTSNGDAGGSWSSTNTSIATVDPASGLVTAVSGGTTNITYTVSTGCNSPVSSFKTLTVGSVNAGTVSGTSPLCIGATATYTSNGDPGGSWSSTNPGVATVNASSGLVTALSAGTTDITYTVGSSSSSKTLTVSPNVNAATVSGASPLCIGATATYTSNGTAGGSWSSTNTGVATVNASSGLVTAVGAGTTNITYTLTGCGGPLTAFATLTVNPNVTAGTVSGVSPLCIGSTATYSSNGTAGGSWSSTNPGVASVNASSGLVTALTNGTTDITYTVSSGCGSPASAFKTLTVSTSATGNAGTVSGTTPLCAGSTTTYTSNGDAGGTWSSTNTSVATVNASSGLVTGVAAGTTNITYTVPGCGGPVSAFKTLTVDMQAPVVHCPGNVFRITGDCEKSIATANATFSDNCSVVTLTWAMSGATGLSSGATGINYVGTKTYNVGVTTVTYTAKDAAGNSSSCSFTVTVKEFHKPSLSCLSNITVDADPEMCSKTLTLANPTFHDNCGVVKLTWIMTGATTGSSPSTGINYVGTQTFNVGQTIVTYIATDASGNFRICSFKVKVKDDEAPVLNCPANISVNISSGCSKSIIVPNPTYSDNCSEIESLSWKMSGETSGSSHGSGINFVGTKVFDIGVTTITYKIKDADGNQSTCSFTVTVVDDIDPTITCPDNQTASTTNNCSKNVSTPNPVYGDNCNVKTLTWVMTGATFASSPSTGINKVGTRSFNIGLTTVTYTVKDASGNSDVCSFTVRVTDMTAPTIRCTGNITKNITGCSSNINTNNPSVDDNCDVVKLTWTMTGATIDNSPAAGINYVHTHLFNVGVTTITYTATDGSGNTDSDNFTVTVKENVDPVISCPPQSNFCGGSGNFTIPTLVASDNCGIASTTYVITGATNRSGTGNNASGHFNTGTSTIKWIVTDASGNDKTCTTKVVVSPSLCRGVILTDTDTDIPVIPAVEFGIKISPNPSSTYFSLRIQSSTEEEVLVRIFSIDGKIIEQQKGSVSQVYRFGDKYINGTYIVEVRQGASRKTAILIRQ